MKEIAKFMGSKRFIRGILQTKIGRSDTIGSGVKNLYKYTPIYSGGGNPEIYEADVFR